MLNQHIENVRKQEAEDFTLSMDKYSFKPVVQKRINRPFEYRKRIAQILHTDLGQILGETKGFSEQQLKGIIEDVEAYVRTYKENPAPRCRNLVKEVKAKIKCQNTNLKTNQKQTH